jgi:hypothetical protein
MVRLRLHVTITLEADLPVPVSLNVVNADLFIDLRSVSFNADR